MISFSSNWHLAGRRRAGQTERDLDPVLFSLWIFHLRKVVPRRHLRGACGDVVLCRHQLRRAGHGGNRSIARRRRHRQVTSMLCQQQRFHAQALNRASSALTMREA